MEEAGSAMVDSGGDERPGDGARENGGGQAVQPARFAVSDAMESDDISEHAPRGANNGKEETSQVANRGGAALNEKSAADQISQASSASQDK